ncbi:protein of unknown function UPF0118 [Alkalidesulfovibrio alkalitolerans DSM 16529]|jgi:predicted PurR-regulated permease PerM|uniref:AI-2E family transporter n=1 Tax=Alkalidesulfovibrio alkalitolerans DSM 16529 TaxID=1121439 RepID=S7T474_9BACT|nr:AI-2E family transporter [Alkalidesulfovibrio alkalitolerans]EPR31391.1 protein of unknown function UPF0118 [Alkalidesulfovibrio alkalitolerans DSM 16529]
MKRLRDIFGRKSDADAFFSWFPILLLLFGLWLLYGIFAPFLDAIIFAAVLAALFSPLFAWTVERVGGRRNLSALLILLLAVVCILIPAMLFLGGLVAQGREALAQINVWLRSNDLELLLKDGSVARWLAWVQEHVPGLDLSHMDIPSRLLGFTQTVGQKILTMSTQILGNAVLFIIHFALMLFFLFYFLKDGKEWLERLKYLLPMRLEQADAVADRLRKVCKAVLVGGLLVATLQGIVGGVGLAMVGLPGLFWGTMMGFASLIPLVGTGLIWVPACLWLLILGKWQASLFLAAWCGIIVVQIDTFLRPYFMKGSSQVPVLFIFLSVIGGVNAFGPAGILYGPLVLAFATTMIKIYDQQYAHVLSVRERPQNGGGVVEAPLVSPATDAEEAPTEAKEPSAPSARAPDGPSSNS